MMTSAEIRNRFMDFFQQKGHAIVPSAPIVLKNDPSLLFTNAGMNQFKDYFLGNKKAPHPRVADTQKCLRVSGKHNDLEEVGVDTYHHTMFEMLGNWSFGDPENPAAGYFKKEAIAWSWELLTGVYGIPKDRLYVTVFQGDGKENLPRDEEAFTEWKTWIDVDRILLGSKKDNFWEMGDTGPCGPCTEIHVDCRSDEERKSLDGAKLVNNDHPQVIEIWNNVFIQYNRLKDGRLEPLPARHVDTGMGLERLVRVLQNKTSNYDTDIFTNSIALTEKLTGAKYDYGENRQAIAFRVLADHIRAIAFTIADGQLPSNTGAGYVIRRILRRAVRYYYSYLGYKQPLLFQLMPQLADQFELVFPELKKQLDFVSRVVREEEEAFLRTLDKGLKKIDDLIRQAQKANNPVISGKDAFELFDTFGFPLDLTRLIATEKNLSVNEADFQAEMKLQKDRSRTATAVDTEDWIIVTGKSPDPFIGYGSFEVKTHVSKYRKVKAKGREAYQLVLDVTPFYAESGGQVGDTGILQFGTEDIRVLDTKKENDTSIQISEQLPQDIQQPVIARIDPVRRQHIAIHHSATHLLHAALRQVLGNHIAQKGSLVNEEHLRFDFSHFAKLSEEELLNIEKIINAKIRENIAVSIEEMPKEEALKKGAMALFGEKYGDRVRVVTIDPHFSVELCGGTHVGYTGELGYFKIKQETAIAAGVRRIEAVSGLAAEIYLDEQLSLLQGTREKLKNPRDLPKAIDALLAENLESRRKIESLEAKQLLVVRDELLHTTEHIEGVSFVGRIVEIGSADALKKLAFELRGSLSNYLIVLAANIEGKAAVVLLIDETLAAHKNLDAGRIIKEQVSPLIRGGGGGQKTLATAGGQDAGNLEAVLEQIKGML